MTHELKQIIGKLPDDLRQKTFQGAKAAQKFIKSPDLLEEDIAHIMKMSPLGTP